jgi:capsular polysaccharide biosynthesis protein
MRPGGDVTPLRPSDFWFHGFDDLRPELERSLREVGIRHGDPLAPVVENAVFVPPVELGERGHFEGALLTEDGQPIPTAQAHRRFGAFGEQLIGSLREPVEIKPERVVDEEVVYLGWYIGHFGHFLLESLARVWILDRIDPTMRVVFHIQRERDLSGMTLRILDAFGVPRDRILELNEQTLLRRVIVPEALYEIAHAAHEGMALLFRRVAASVVAGEDRSDQPVYLSRRLLPSTQREIVGEFEMEEVFRENGFLVAHPETMTLEDQIRLVNRHRDVFTSAGSAVYGTLFSLSPLRVHFLTAGIPILDYFLVPKAAGAEASYSNCFAGDDTSSLWYLPPRVEMDKLSAYLDSLGLLRRRLRASLAARLGGLNARHDEARLYTHVRHCVVRRPLPAEIEAEALHLARSSWPVSWVLACYYAFNDPSRADPMARQFVDLVAAESDVGRLAHFHQDVEGRARRVVRECDPETATRLIGVLWDRFEIDLRGTQERLQRQRGRQGAGAKRTRSANPTPAG